MARKSLADKIRESGRATQKELENSKKILKNILEPSLPKKTTPNKNITETASDNVSDLITDSLSDIITDRISDNNSDTVSEKNGQAVSDNDKSVTRSVTGSVINKRPPLPKVKRSVTGSVINKIRSFDKALSFHSVFLSNRQSEVYSALLKYGESGFITQTHISATTGIPLPTVRKSIRVMKERGVLNYKRYQSEGRKGILFSINTNVKIDQVSKLSVTGSVTMSPTSSSPKSSLSESVTGSVTSLPSSSSFIKNETTTLKKIEQIVISEPELGYWRELKLKPQQIRKWMKELSLEIDDIIDSLKHCRFDLIDNGLLESKPVRDPLSWVYKRLKQYGYYHAPKGYVSFEDKAIQRAKERLRKKEERARELAAIREAELEAERRIEFEKMMADHESDVYKKCFNKLNKIEKKLEGKGFVRSMRSAFDKLLEESPIEPNNEAAVHSPSSEKGYKPGEG